MPSDSPAAVITCHAENSPNTASPCLLPRQRVFHYLGPVLFAVLLFSSIAPPGVAWLCIGSAGLIFCGGDKAIIAALGMTLLAAAIGVGVVILGHSLCL